MFNKFLIAIFLLTALVSCSNKEEDPCSSAENKDNEECAKNIGTTENNKLSLNLTFYNSYFYNKLEKTWVTISQESLFSGVIPNSVPMYSSVVKMKPDDAVDRIIQAKTQMENSDSFQESELSIIPYIELKYESGVEYIYSYVKKTLEGVPVKSSSGKFIVYNNRAILPFVNEMFGGQFYAEDEEIGKRYLHTITIGAYGNNTQGQTTQTIEFESHLESEKVNYNVVYSDEMKSFNMENRFKYYFNSTDNVVNENLKFFKLQEVNPPEVTQTSVKILFKKKPVLKIDQELFFEFMFNLEKLKQDPFSTPSVVRGQSFYVQPVRLDSDKFFKMKIKVNGQERIVENNAIIIENYPANTSRDIEFFYDLRTNDSYNDPKGTPLIHPFKPSCNEMFNLSFSPLATKQDKKLARDGGGFYAVCHPQTNGPLYLSKTDLITTTYDQSDVFYEYFNYIPEDVLKSDAGQFNGLRSVKFSIDGCVRVYVKSATDVDWKLKSITDNACVDPNDPTNSEGWVYFNAEKTFLISDDVSKFIGITGLSTLVQSFGSRPLKKTPFFKFNGLTGNLEHIY